MPHGFGWDKERAKEQRRDHRNYSIMSIPGIKLAEPPSNDLHLGEFMQAVKDQKDLGACTAFAGAEDREAIAAQYEGKTVTLSPLFLYYIERQIDGEIGQDAGSTGQTSCQAINQFGICLESDDPYDPSQFRNAPTSEQLTAALTFKAGAYHSIYSAVDMKTCINSGYRVRVGMDVYQSFEDVGSDGLVAVPDPGTEQILGGHEVLCWGYDDSVRCPKAQSDGAFRFRNSWGTSFGLNGDFWLAQELFGANSIIEFDAKIQHLGPPWGK